MDIMTLKECGRWSEQRPVGVGDPMKAVRKWWGKEVLSSTFSDGEHSADVLPGEAYTADVLDVHLRMYAAHLGGILINGRKRLGK